MTDTHRFRVLRPRLTDWLEEEGTSIEDAVQTYHLARCSRTWADNSVGVLLHKEDDKVEQQWFAVFEDENGEELISRICVSGMWRRGGVGGNTLADVARKLDCELVEFEAAGEWLGEEAF